MPFNNPQLQPEVVAGILSGLANEQGDYIADRAVPASPTMFATGSIPTLDGGSHFGLAAEDGRRGPGGQVSVGPGVNYGTVDYQIELYDRAERIGKELVRRGGQIPVPLLTHYLAMCVHFLRVGREVRLDALINATTWAANTALAGAQVWDQAGSDPAADISAAMDAIVGGRPNTIIMGRGTWNSLRTNDTLLGQLSITRDNALLSESVFASAIASHFNIPEDRVFIGRAQRLTTNNPDDASDPASLTDIHGDYFFTGRIGNFVSPLENRDLLVEPTAIARVVETDFEDNFEQEYLMPYKAWQVQTGLGEHILDVTTGLGSLITNTVT